MLNYERPNYPIYPVYKDGKLLDAKPCAFCRELSSNELLREKVGPVYGPVRVNKREEYFVHELCVMWTPEICLTVINKF